MEKINYLKKVIYSFSNKLNLHEFDSPVIESNNLLLGKYGDEAETKLIIKIKDSNEALRYDQTVPLQRIILENRFDNLRRIQFGKVFRDDKPQPEKGRFREFYQLDIDLVNQTKTNPRLDIFWLMFSVLDELKLDYQIKYNYRDNLYKILEKSEIFNKKLYPKICSQIDKLDKMTFDEIKPFLYTLGLTNTNLEKLSSLLFSNYLDNSLEDNNKVFQDTLQKIIPNPDNISKLVFTPSLARGLDYYTGIIFEVVINNSNLGSIIAGGEYNKLLYNLNSKGERKYLDAIGVSFGISRMEKLDFIPVKSIKQLYLITNQNKIEMLYQLRNKLNNFTINTNFLNSTVIKEITFAVKNNYDFIIIYGENNDKFKLKELFNKNDDLLFDTFDDIINYLRE
jgi:histidyl-tRNA synthetase